MFDLSLQKILQRISENVRWQHNETDTASEKQKAGTEGQTAEMGRLPLRKACQGSEVIAGSSFRGSSRWVTGLEEAVQTDEGEGHVVQWYDGRRKQVNRTINRVWNKQL